MDMKYKLRSFVIVAVCLGSIMVGCGETPKDKSISNQKNKNTAPTNNQDGSSETAKLATATALISNVSEADLAAADGQKIYKNYCITCHGPNGDMSLNKAKPLTKSTLDLTNIVSQVYHGKGLMTPYAKVLKPAELLAVSKFVESLQK